MRGKGIFKSTMAAAITIHVKDQDASSPGIRVHHLYHDLPSAYGTFRTVSSEEMDAGRFKTHLIHALDPGEVPHFGLLEALIFTCFLALIRSRRQDGSGEAEARV